MEQIPWERAADGTRAQLKEGSHSAKIPVLSLLYAATEKMTELILISADFNGETIVFERQIGIYLEKGAHAEFIWDRKRLLRRRYLEDAARGYA